MILSAVQSTSSWDTSSTTSSSSSSASLNDAVLEFMEYAKETPAQRMFDNWLSSQNISMQQFNSMSDADKTALLSKYEEYLREKLEAQMGDGSSSAAVSVASA